MTNVRGGRQASNGSLFEELVPSAAWTEDSNFHYLLVDLPGFKKEWLILQVHDHGHILVGGERQTETKLIHFEQTFQIPENSDKEKISGRYEGGILYVIVPKLVKDKEREPLNPGSTHGHDQEELKEKHEHDLEEHNEKHEHDLQEHNEKHEHNQEEQYGGGHIGHHGQNDDNKKVVEEGGLQEAITDIWRVEGGLLGSLVETLRKNKGIVVTAVLAFSLGVYFSQKFQSNDVIKGGLSPM